MANVNMYLRMLLPAAALVLTACTPPADGLRDEPAVPGDLKQVRELAEKAYAAEDWPASEKYYDALVKQIPMESAYWFRLGNIYARTERPEPAVAAYREALVRAPGNAKAWHNLGVLYLREAASSFAQMSANVEPSDPLYGRGQSIYAGIKELLAGRFDDAPRGPVLAVDNELMTDYVEPAGADGTGSGPVGIHETVGVDPPSEPAPESAPVPVPTPAAGTVVDEAPVTPSAQEPPQPDPGAATGLAE